MLENHSMPAKLGGHRMRRLSLVLALVVGLGGSAWAVPLAPGESQPSELFILDPDADVKAGPLVTPYSSSGGPSGVVRAAVIQESSLFNDLLGLTFIYQVTNTLPAVPSSQVVSRVTHSSFAHWSVDVGHDITGIDTLPTDFSPPFTAMVGVATPQEVDRGPNGETIGFDFKPSPFQINGGETSAIMVIRTNAPGFRVGNTAIINGSTAEVATFAPVPEPGFYGLLATGLAGIFFMTYNRRKRTADR
jgi:hypothetical protein